MAKKKRSSSKKSQAGVDQEVEQLVDLLVELDDGRGVPTRDLAERMGVDSVRLRYRLRHLQRIGIVYRTGRARGTRWHLG